MRRAPPLNLSYAKLPPTYPLVLVMIDGSPWRELFLLKSKSFLLRLQELSAL